MHLNNLIRIALVIEYDGRRYHGFQWQNAQPTVQNELEKAILKLTGERSRVTAACRTDSGVHALGQVISFRTGSKLPLSAFIEGLNYYLPEDIAVKKAGQVSLDFNVMKNAIRREYIYKILNRRIRSPFYNNYFYQVPIKLDGNSMDRACKLLIGEHDFASFVTSWTSRGSTVRRVYEAKIENEGDILTFFIAANSFLTHQVRNIVGTLIRVGTGKITVNDFENILESKKISLAGPTAPAHGLYLKRVVYPDNLEFKYENIYC